LTRTDSTSLHSSFQLPKSCLSGESARARTTLKRDPWRGHLDSNNIHPHLHSHIRPALSSSLRLPTQQLFAPPCNAPSCALLRQRFLSLYLAPLPSLRRGQLPHTSIAKHRTTCHRTSRHRSFDAAPSTSYICACATLQSPPHVLLNCPSWSRHWTEPR
jgi:hypothetical protein